MWYSVAGLRKVVAKDKLQFSRRYNEVVLGFQKIEARASKHVIHNDDDSGHIMPSTQVDLTFLAQRLKVQKIRPFQASALQLLLDALPNDTKIIQAPTSMGKDLLPFALAAHSGKAQLVFVPFVALGDHIVFDGQGYASKVVKLAEIGKTVTLETAAANADVIVCSYEHAQRALRLVQELQLRERLGTVSACSIILCYVNNTCLHCTQQ